MGAGKILCILGGIVTLLATFLFSFAPFLPGTYLYGIGFIMNIPTWFTSGDILIIIMAIVFIIFLLSGIFILIGVSSRALAIIGSLFAIIVGVYFVLVFYIGLPLEIAQFALMFIGTPLVDGIIPLNIAVGDASLGTILVLAGGVLGLIGGIMGTDGI